MMLKDSNDNYECKLLLKTTAQTIDWLHGMRSYVKAIMISAVTIKKVNKGEEFYLLMATV